jgi:DNA primase RepB-like protein
VSVRASQAAHLCFQVGGILGELNVDHSSADWRHFGRLAGFTNPKPEQKLPSGLRPFARLRSATGHVYAKAAEFRSGIMTSSDGQTEQGEQLHKRLRRSKERVGIKPLKQFHTDPMYAGDLHRADMAWAKHAAECGLTLAQMKEELLNGRDLSKGNCKRQMEYVARTAEKALRSL